MRTQLLGWACAGAVVLAGCGSGGPSSTPSSTGASTPSTTASATTSVTATGPTTGATTTPTGGASPSRSTASTAGLTPLWPFTSLAGVQTWQAAYRSGGVQPWHLDVAATALAFTRDHLGYSEVDRVTSQLVTGGDAKVGVGWSDPETRSSTVAVLHLIRYGVGQDAPWVVVGSQDTLLTLTTPGYGSAVSSPLRVGGVISGVDESLHVKLLAATSSAPIAEINGIPAGGEKTPWTAKLAFSAPSGSVLTVAVSTGGHIKQVERFAITAVRVR